MTPNPNPYGQPQGMFPPAQPMAPPVPFSATLLWLCGILKIIPAVLCMIGGGFVLAGTAAFAADPNGGGSGGGGLFGGLLVLGGGILGAVLLVGGFCVLLSGIFDTIAGSLARKGRSIGRVLGIISSILGMLGAGGSFFAVIFAPQNENANGMVGGLFGTLPALAINTYILISFISNADSFRN